MILSIKHKFIKRTRIFNNQSKYYTNFKSFELNNYYEKYKIHDKQILLYMETHYYWINNLGIDCGYLFLEKCDSIDYIYFGSYIEFYFKKYNIKIIEDKKYHVKIQKY